LTTPAPPGVASATGRATFGAVIAARNPSTNRGASGLFVVIPGRAKREPRIHNPVTAFYVDLKHRGYGFRAHAKRRVPE
jgi:hypothetical protein